ncbi:DUF2786 domain-containing protein [Micromonospora sonneratiae]|uniref:DUF2786 domain-containing protein n=1 Tax=Micromonospora sonneratiae TaxID=1184706 RepID=A0ABW3YFU9_9ACTN
MGIRNQQRRAAKKKAREQRQRGRTEAAAGAHGQSGRVGDAFDPWTSSREERTSEEWIAELLNGAVYALLSQHPDQVERQLDQLTVGEPGLVDRLVAEAFQDVVGQLWERGWLPADLVRVVRRRHGQRAAQLTVEQIAAQLRGYSEVTVHERWHAQLRELGAAVWQGYADHRLTAWGQRQKLDRSEALRDVVSVLSVLTALPDIGKVTPLPGTVRGNASRAGTATGATIDERVLGRVRGLLAKAESTEFPEEAEALSAKAQELMARHSIDRALLAAGQTRGGSAGATARTMGAPWVTGAPDQPVALRVGVDAPYEQAKALLLQEVATANRCRSVWSADFGFATVLGFPSDAESVELLYTSLLVQATAAMVRGGPQRGRAGQSTTRSFRQSFLQAYAVRIGERLRAATDEVSREVVVEAGADRLLPVLAAREDVVREAVETMFPEMVQRQVRGSHNAAGWAAGTAAADLAALAARSEVSGRT